MSSNEQCHFELALVKVRRIRHRWSGGTPGVAAGSRSRTQGAEHGERPRGTHRTAGTGTGGRRVARGPGEGCEGGAAG